MHLYSFRFATAALVLSTLPAFAIAKPHRASSSGHASLHHTALHGKSSSHAAIRHVIPAAMPTERATQIQTALIKGGYLSGEPTGAWDATTVAAMQKLQADNGWQTKITPDSRALIKLGLGPQDKTEAQASAAPPAPIR